MDEEVQEEEEPPTPIKDDEDTKDNMKPLIMEMDKDIKMMTGSLKYLMEDMSAMNKAMTFMKDDMKRNNMKGAIKNMNNTMSNMFLEMQYLKEDVKNMIANVKFMGEAAEYLMQQEAAGIKSDDLVGMEKAMGNMDSYKGYMGKCIGNLNKVTMLVWNYDHNALNLEPSI